MIVEPIAEQWNGSAWSMSVLSLRSELTWGELTSLSCRLRSSCMAVGDAQTAEGPIRYVLAEHWNGRGWVIQELHQLTPANSSDSMDLTGLSCPSLSACVATGAGFFDGAGPTVVARDWNGRRWKDDPINIDGSLARISCATRQACLAVGAVGRNSGLLGFWNGTKWRFQSNNTWAFNDVACSSSQNCTGVGNGRIARWNGMRWLKQTIQAPRGSDFTAVSCPSSGGCVAIGFDRKGLIAARLNGQR